jgi:hypothetical protein
MNNRSAIFIAMLMTTLLSASALPVMEYGEDGYDRVLAMADEEGTVWLKYHMQLADTWGKLYYLTAIIGMIAMVTGFFRPQQQRHLAFVLILCAVFSLMAGGFIADAGGKIRHREFRTDQPPPQVDEHVLDHDHHSD